MSRKFALSRLWSATEEVQSVCIEKIKSKKKDACPADGAQHPAFGFVKQTDDGESGHNHYRESRDAMRFGHLRQKGARRVA